MEVIEGETASTGPPVEGEIAAATASSDACEACGRPHRCGSSPPRYALSVSAGGAGGSPGASSPGAGGQGMVKEGSFLDASFALQEPPVIE